jgi:hypothetical protein
LLQLPKEPGSFQYFFPFTFTPAFFTCPKLLNSAASGYFSIAGTKYIIVWQKINSTSDKVWMIRSTFFTLKVAQMLALSPGDKPARNALETTYASNTIIWETAAASLNCLPPGLDQLW